MKVIKIENCWQCPNANVINIREDPEGMGDTLRVNYCLYDIDFDGSHIFVEIRKDGEIPEWCPLEDDIGNLTMDYRELSDADARIEIKYSLNKMKREGYKNFNVIDVMIETELPPDQINKILKELKDEVNP